MWGLPMSKLQFLKKLNELGVEFILAPQSLYDDPEMVVSVEQLIALINDLYPDLLKD